MGRSVVCESMARDLAASDCHEILAARSIWGDSSPWELVPANFSFGGAGTEHWATTLGSSEVDPWQLFVSEWGAIPEIYVNARWPNVQHIQNHDRHAPLFSSSSWRKGVLIRPYEPSTSAVNLVNVTQLQGNGTNMTNRYVA